MVEVEAVLSRVLGPGVGLGVEPVSGAEGLRPVEAIAVARAVPKRVAEFAAGRRAARRALDSIGREAVDLPAGPNRAPVWPEGVTGSITHDGDLALAAVALLGEVRSLGLDLTEAAPLPGATRGHQDAVFHDAVVRAMHLHGALGVSNELPLAGMLLGSLALGIADGSTEVHKMTIARQVLKAREGERSC